MIETRRTTALLLLVMGASGVWAEEPKMKLTRPPTVETELRIRRPVAEVFEAFVNPEITSKFWFRKGTAPLKTGKTVTWYFGPPGVYAEVRVKSVEKNERILIVWEGEDGAARSVEWLFRPAPDDSTYVSISERGFAGDADTVVRSSIASMGGFTWVLSALKIYLEHGIDLNIVKDANVAKDTKMELKATPVAVEAVRIRAPLGEVFEAFVNPDVTTKFWIDRGTARLKQGKTVTWYLDTNRLAIEVRVLSLEENRRIHLEWTSRGFGTTMLEWLFNPGPEDSTYVVVRESGFAGDADSIARKAIESTGGLALVLAAAKVYLEYEIESRLVEDRECRAIAEVTAQSPPLGDRGVGPPPVVGQDAHSLPGLAASRY